LATKCDIGAQQNARLTALDVHMTYVGLRLTLVTCIALTVELNPNSDMLLPPSLKDIASPVTDQDNNPKRLQVRGYLEGLGAALVLEGMLTARLVGDGANTLSKIVNVILECSTDATHDATASLAIQSIQRLQTGKLINSLADLPTCLLPFSRQSSLLL